MTRNQLTAQLYRIRERAEFTRTRVGYDGCPVRLEAADDIAALDVALELIEQLGMDYAPLTSIKAREV